jgi:hypothetical protein
MQGERGGTYSEDIRINNKADLRSETRGYTNYDECSGRQRALNGA